MSEQGSQILKGAGKGFEVLKAITDSVLMADGDDSHIERILRDSDLRNELGRFLRSWPVAERKVVLERAVRGSLDGMLLWGAARKVGLAPQRCDKRFFKLMSSLIEFSPFFATVVRYGREAAIQDVAADTSAHGKELATLVELLTFAAAHGDVARQFAPRLTPLAALGSPVVPDDGVTVVPVLLRSRSGDLILAPHRIDDLFRSNFNFLVRA